MLETFPKITLWDVIDILIVAFLIYRIFIYLSQTRAIQILIGLLFLLILSVIAKFFHLYTLSFIFNNLITIGIFALLVIFQPEIRRILARIGEKHFGIFSSEEEAEKVIEEIVRAAAAMSEDRIGALMVIEREVNLDNYVEAGTAINGEVSKELLITIFWPGTPLHDGATIIRRNKIYKAGAFLPLSLNPNLPQTVGTRHRAAIGITEETDAVVVVVSEETGAVSVAYTGKLIKDLDPQKLKKVLKGLLVKKAKEKNSFFSLRRSKSEEAA
ncbi:diadenylate cyclase CdaA [Phorcysia thermohydrogeniphila]|uniref:Diadenylate cyclase n=1 Tax=Phorcysia thermohydrogeniphila TaxID=936138 RepID=A0A4R1GKD7_9BACT|nr:diadenylate cyclase CdaA [Phorcysia thermohydrogeniphila]TCK06489.1 diadenylate cyclase [Phorcysia thermohydrogeniphila]